MGAEWGHHPSLRACLPARTIAYAQVRARAYPILQIHLQTRPPTSSTTPFLILLYSQLHVSDAAGSPETQPQRRSPAPPWRLDGYSLMSRGMRFGRLLLPQAQQPLEVDDLRIVDPRGVPFLHVAKNDLRSGAEAARRRR